MIEGAGTAELNFEGALRQLAEPDTLPDAGLVRMLSAPTSDEVDLWVKAWAGIEADRRRWIANNLRDTAEASFELEFTGLFTSLLNDGDSEIRALAIDGLWEARDPRLASRFSDLLAGDEDVHVRARAAVALGRFVLLGELDEISPQVSSRAVAMLIDAADDEGEDIEVRRRATESAGYADSPEVRQIIRDGLASGDESLHAGALRAMGNSADEAWGPEVVAGLSDTKPKIQFEAARAAGELTLLEAVPSLITLAASDDREVQYEAVCALGEIGGRAAASALERLVANTTDQGLLSAVEEAMAMAALDDGAIQVPNLGAVGGTDGAGEWNDDLTLHAWLSEGDESER